MVSLAHGVWRNIDGDLYVATNTLQPVTGNLQPGIVKISASGVQIPFATLSVVNFSAEAVAIVEQATCLSWRLIKPVHRCEHHFQIYSGRSREHVWFASRAESRPRV